MIKQRCTTLHNLFSLIIFRIHRNEDQTPHRIFKEYNYYYQLFPFRTIYYIHVINLG